MKKFFAVIAVSALAIAGVACGGSSSQSAKELYTQFAKHYSYVAEAFGVNAEDETFEEYVADLSDCDHIDGESAAFAGLFVGATLAEHGDDVAGFVRDNNRLMDALKAEGLCPKGSGSSDTDSEPEVTTTTEAPTTTTTVDTDALKNEIETKCWQQWNDLNDTETTWQNYGYASDHGADWQSKGRQLAGLYRDGAKACTGYIASGTIDSMNEIAGIIEQMIAIYA